MVNPLLEELSSLEHDQWISWAKSLLKSGPSISKERAARWEKLFVPYAKLSEESKEQDREHARKVLAILQDKKMNKYLEKVANALTRAIGKGLVTGASGISEGAISAAGKSGLSAKGSQFGASALNRSLTGETTFGRISTAKQQRGLIGKNTLAPKSVVNTNLSMGGSTDALAKSTFQGRVAANKAAITAGRVPPAKPTTNVFGGEIKRAPTAAAPVSAVPDQAAVGGNSLFSKAKSLADKYPRATVGLGAAGAAGVVGYNIGSNSNNRGY